MSSPKSMTLPVWGRISPMISLSRTLLPTPAGPSSTRVSPGATEKVMSVSTGGPSKARLKRRARRRQDSASGAGGGGLKAQGGSVAHVGKKESNTWVMRKSTAMMSTEELTTAEMVERPTPSVPPVVLMP